MLENAVLIKIWCLRGHQVAMTFARSGSKGLLGSGSTVTLTLYLSAIPPVNHCASLPILLVYDAESLPLCYPPHSQFTTLLACYSRSLPLCQPVILQVCHSASLSFYKFATLPACHSTSLPLCQPVKFYKIYMCYLRLRLGYFFFGII